MDAKTPRLPTRNFPSAEEEAAVVVEPSRYAGPDVTYDDNNRKLLQELKGVPPADLTARFRCVCVACLPDGRELAAEGVLEGRITTAPRGANGFGYDPLFEVEDTGRTMAELSEAEKNAVSHRARAVRALAARLATALPELVGGGNVA